MINLEDKKTFFDSGVNCYEKIWRQMDENNIDFVIYSLSKSIFNRAKTINDLIHIGSTESLGVLSRSLYELYLSIRYILEDRDDSINRANSFFYQSRIDYFSNLLSIEKNLPGSLRYNEEHCNHEVSGAKNVNDLITYYKTERKKLFKYKTTDRWDNRHWYDLNQKKKTSLLKLMKRLNIDKSLYSYIYGIGSMDVHGTGSINHIALSLGIDAAVQISVLEKISFIITLDTLKALKEFYRFNIDDLEDDFNLMEESFIKIIA
ncbi:DUF5677 domain-containing protein [Enterococcus hirae]